MFPEVAQYVTHSKHIGYVCDNRKTENSSYATYESSVNYVMTHHNQFMKQLKLYHRVYTIQEPHVTVKSQHIV